MFRASDQVQINSPEQSKDQGEEAKEKAGGMFSGLKNALSGAGDKAKEAGNSASEKASSSYSKTTSSSNVNISSTKVSVERLLPLYVLSCCWMLWDSLHRCSCL